MAISEQILHPSGSEAPVPVAPPTPAPVAPAVELVALTPGETVTIITPVVPAPEPEATPVEAIPLLPAVAESGAVVSAAKTAWNWSACAARALNGVRTLLFFGVMGVMALGAKLADLDLSGILSAVMGGKVDAADITVFMSIGGIVLRFLTTTQVFARWRKAAQGDKVPEASAAVDEPDDESN